MVYYHETYQISLLVQLLFKQTEQPANFQDHNSRHDFSLSVNARHRIRLPHQGELGHAETGLNSVAGKAGLRWACTRLWTFIHVFMFSMVMDIQGYPWIGNYYWMTPHNECRAMIFFGRTSSVNIYFFGIIIFLETLEIHKISGFKAFRLRESSD